MIAHRTLSAIFSVFLFFAPAATLAAQAAGTITWQSSGYVPAGYRGKILPTSGATITALLMIMDGGTLPAMSGRSVRWYVDGDLLATQKGTAPFSFQVPLTGQSTVTLRASVPGYAAGDLDTFLDLPIVRPDVVIDRARLPELKPLFYFFSARDPAALSVEWDDAPGNVTVRAKNPANPFEFAESVISKNR